MSLILAVEPDRHRAAQLTDMARAHLDADMIVSATVAQAFQSLGARVPDVLLTAPLLPPSEESALDDYLRLIGPAAAHVQSLTIPVLGSAGAAVDRGLLSSFRKAAREDSEGCEPSEFASQISQYLKEARSRARRTSAHPAAPPLVQPPVSDRTCTPLTEAEVQEAVVDLSPMLEAVAEPEETPQPEAMAYPEVMASSEVLASPEVLPSPEVLTSPEVLEVVAPEETIVEPSFVPAAEEQLPEIEDAPPILEPEPVLAPDAVFAPESSEPLALAQWTPDPHADVDNPIIELEPERPTHSNRILQPEAVRKRDRPRTSTAMVVRPKRNGFAHEPAEPPVAMPAAALPATIPGTVQQIIAVPTGNGTHVQTSVNVAVAVSVQVGAAVNVTGGVAVAKRTGKPKPVQDEWGFFDPGQCGFQALVARLDAIAATEDER